MPIAVFDAVCGFVVQLAAIMSVRATAETILISCFMLNL
jgi:hypothetical protein